MASIRQRSGTWQARVRRKGYPDEVASFKTKTEAQAWARSIESAMDHGAHQSNQSAKDILLADVLQRYMNEVTPSKRGAQREAEGIQYMMRQKIASYSMTNDLRPVQNEASSSFLLTGPFPGPLTVPMAP
jgi:dsDNA-binding SOS-regulon protein